MLPRLPFMEFPLKASSGRFFFFFPRNHSLSTPPYTCKGLFAAEWMIMVAAPGRIDPARSLSLFLFYLQICLFNLF